MLLHLITWLLFRLSAPVPTQIQVSSRAGHRNHYTNVAAGDDDARQQPGAHKKGEDENLGRPAVGQIVETASRQISFGHVLADTEQRQRSERCRISPNEEDDGERSETCDFLIGVQRAAYDQISID